jgi:hypothetical protein
MCQCKYLHTQPSKSQWQLYEPPVLALVKCTSVPGVYLSVPYGSQIKKWLLILHSNNQIDGPGVDSASNRNEYQVYFLGVKAAGA